MTPPPTPWAPPHPKGPGGLTAICAVSVLLLSHAASNITMAMTGFPLTVERWLATLAAIAVGSWLMYLGHCRLLHPGGGR